MSAIQSAMNISRVVKRAPSVARQVKRTLFRPIPKIITTNNQFEAMSHTLHQLAHKTDKKSEELRKRLLLERFDKDTVFGENGANLDEYLWVGSHGSRRNSVVHFVTAPPGRYGAFYFAKDSSVVASYAEYCVLDVYVRRDHVGLVKEQSNHDTSHEAKTEYYILEEDLDHTRPIVAGITFVSEEETERVKRQWAEWYGSPPQYTEEELKQQAAFSRFVRNLTD